MTTQRSARLLACALALACLAPGAAAAQGPDDGRWMPWLGCWAPVAVQPTTSAADELMGLPPEQGPPAAALLCVSPAEDGAGIVVATVRNGKEEGRRTLIADGEEREVELEGCRGVESAHWSQDGGRVFYRTEYTCEGGVERRSSGATMMLPNGHWLDAEVVRAGDARALEVRRYRFATDAEYRAHGREPPTGNALALETARKAAAATLSVGDVIEAAAAVDEEVVQALLADYGGRFPLDAQALVKLADAGVSSETIDLMIALSYPDRFVVDRSALAAAFRQPDPAQPATADDALGYSSWNYGYRGFWGSSWLDPWDYGRSGYGYPGLYYGYPYGYGDPYLRYPYYRRIWTGPPSGQIIVVERKPDAGGRAVPGRGYTRTNRDVARGTAVRTGRAGSGIESGRSSVVPSSGGGRATAGGGYKASDDNKASSGDSGGRKAKRKGDGSE